MPNVIRLRGKPTRASATPMETTLASETITRVAKMHSIVAGIHSIAKNRLQATVSLLEMTVLNIRHLSTMIGDPDVRAVIQGELATLESALSSARERAQEL